MYKKAESQMRQLEILRERGWRDVDIGFFGDGKALTANTGRGGAGSQQRQQNQQQQQPKSENNPLLSKHDREQITLNITPGTAYMDRVTNALLYWAWKCVSNPFWPKFDNKNGHHVTNQHGMSRGQVKIYINPSYVPGEGEIKLLDWIMRGHDSHFSKGHRPSILVSCCCNHSLFVC